FLLCNDESICEVDRDGAKYGYGDFRTLFFRICHSFALVAHGKIALSAQICRKAFASQPHNLAYDWICFLFSQVSSCYRYNGVEQYVSSICTYPCFDPFKSKNQRKTVDQCRSRFCGSHLDSTAPGARSELDCS